MIERERTRNRWACGEGQLSLGRSQSRCKEDSVLPLLLSGSVALLPLDIRGLKFLTNINIWASYPDIKASLEREDLKTPKK